MRASKVLPLSCLFLLAAAAACGGISDPSQEQVATVTGSLTGGAAAPANARVALVWRDGTTGGYSVGADVPIVNGHFSMALTVPTNAYFFPYDSDTTNNVTPPLPREEQAQPDNGAVATPPSSGSGGGTPTPGGGKVPNGKLGAQDNASGSIITESLTIAVSGFVVYADTNGNGALDLEGPNATSPDQILGGNQELFLAYLKGGGALDYEKLRDKSGILPQHGFNLAWQQGRWLTLDLVELKLTSHPSLPSPVCYGGGTVSSSGGGSGGVKNDPGAPSPPPVDQDGGTFGEDASTDGGNYGYPSPNDPGLSCAPDGRSFTYTPQPIDCPPPPPPTPAGLCGGGGYGYDEPAIGCATSGMMSSKLGPNETPPPGWPCDVTGAVDGGPAPDSGPTDAGAGPG
jgi:hypothetical protein